MHRSMCCLGWIVKVTAKRGWSTMGEHRPADIRTLLRKGWIMPAGTKVIEGKRRKMYQPTQEGHGRFCEWYDADTEGE